MTQFRKKPVVITAITFDQLVTHGTERCKAEGRESNIVNGMPLSFSYAGHPITHENDDCYLIPTLEGTMKMGRDDMLITGVKGEIYPCKRDIFEATYDAAPADLEREIQANSHHSGCKGERCMASAANGYAHSRECIDEAGEAQGWTPTAEDYAKCGPSAGCCGAAPTDSHASAVLYPAIDLAMRELQTLPPEFNAAVNRAFNHLHDAFWSECPAPASAAPKRPDFPGV